MILTILALDINTFLMLKNKQQFKFSGPCCCMLMARLLYTVGNIKIIGNILASE